MVAVITQLRLTLVILVNLANQHLELVGFGPGASLNYLYRGLKTQGRGRPKKYDGKIDYKKLKDDYFTLIENS
jgi:hypothetical protein